MADIRLGELSQTALTANGKLLDRAIRHAIFLERLKTRQVNDVVGFLNEKVIPDIEAQIERRLTNIATRGQATNASRVRRLRQLHEANRQLVSNGIALITERTTRRMRDIATMEAISQRDLLKRAVAPLDLDFALPAVSTLEAIVTTRPMQGRTMRRWFKGIDNATRAAIEGQINIGIAQGEAVPTIVQRIRGTRAAGFADGVMQGTRRNTEAIVRTAVNHVTSQAREATYARNSDVVREVRYVATLDSRTTQICIELDGQVFPINEGPRPPQHINCRSTTVPVLKSFKELGIDLKEAPPGTRASMDGQVPAVTTYKDWLKGQPKRVQEDVLGKTKADLFRRGKIRSEKFVDRRGKTLTLKQLARKEGLRPEDFPKETRARVFPSVRSTKK